MASQFIKLPLVTGSGGGAVDSFNGRTGVVASQAGDYSAALISNVPAGSISAVTVQDALNELDTEKASTAYVDTHVVSNTYLNPMPALTIKANATGSLASPQDIDGTAATALLVPMVGENGSVAGSKGLAPAPALYDGFTKHKFLRADGTWNAQTGKYAARGEAVSALASFTARSSVANGFFGICYSPELNLFVAVSSAGTNRISISKDGMSWRDIAAPANNTWTKVCWSPQLGIFCAVSFDGANRCMTSPDGINWTLQTIAAETWYDITWSPQLGLFCAVGLTGGTGISTSPDGVTWTQQTSGATTNFYSVAWSPELGLFAAIRLNGPVYTSPDGVNWTSRTISNNSWSSITWSSELGIFCAVGITGSSRAATSPDGITWTNRAIGSQSWRTVVWAAELGVFVALSSGGQLAYSYDGITWTNGANPQATNQWYTTCWSKEAGVLVIGAITGTNRLMTTKYTRSWANTFVPNQTSIPLRQSATSITLTLVNANNLTLTTAATPVTITVPTNAAVPFKLSTKIKVSQYGAGSVTFSPDVGVTIRSRSGLLTINGQYATAQLEKIATDEWLLDGDLV